MTQGNPSFLTGTLELIVLQLLQAEPTNGYDLTLRIQTISNDVLNINAGSLYPALHRLEQKGWIESSWGTSENNRRAKYYSLTPLGQKHLASETESWKRFAGAVELILGTT